MSGIIPVGSRVVIKDYLGVLPGLGGVKATVEGHEHNPPRFTSRLRLVVDGPVTLKWPHVCPWHVDVLEEEERADDEHLPHG